ncbi:MAG: hypothetical protein AAF721_04420 [Myxococcota bacterium]
MEQELVDLLLDGTLVLVTTDAAPRLLDGPAVTPLADLVVDGPGGQEPSRPELPPEPVAATLDLTLVTEAGSPLPDIELEIRLTSGESRAVTTAQDGRVFIEDLARAGECAVTLTNTIELSPAADDTIPDTAVGGIRIGRSHGDPILLVTDEPHTIVVLRPRVRVLELADGYFGEARKVLLFAPEGGHGRGRFEERVTARAVFRTLFDVAGGYTVLVAGHTDTVGGGADNQALSDARAQSVHLYLSGQRHAWADHAQGAHTADDLHATLRWVAKVEGVACQPNQGLGQALAEFRRSFVPAQAPAGDADKTTADDWRAVYDLYDRDLARLLHVEPHAIADFRSKVVFVEHEPIGCGERYPVEAVGKNGFESDSNRRVDILLFADADQPTFSAEAPDVEIYGGTYLAERLRARGETVARIFVVDEDESPSPAATVAIKTPTGWLEQVVDADGYAEVLCLVGDTIEVQDARSQGDDLILSSSESGAQPVEG